jgi:hypothetical protein
MGPLVAAGHQQAVQVPQARGDLRLVHVQLSKTGIDPEERTLRR